MKVNFKELSPFYFAQLKESITGWKLGNGYELQGQFLLSEEGFSAMKFQGKVVAEDFECMGYQWKKLESKAQLFANEAILENLQIKDDTGQLNVKKALFAKRSAESGWSFSIPLLLFPIILLEKSKGNLIKTF